MRGWIRRFRFEGMPVFSTSSTSREMSALCCTPALPQVRQVIEAAYLNAEMVEERGHRRDETVPCENHDREDEAHELALPPGLDTPLAKQRPELPVVPLLEEARESQAGGGQRE